jgi:hypothetical protein
LLVEFGHDLLGLEMGMECDELLSHFSDHCNLLSKKSVKAGDVFLDIAARLVHLVKEGHLLLNQIDNIVNVSTVARDELLLFL